MSEYRREYRIAQLISKEMAGDLSPEECEELETWKNGSSGAAKLYAKISDAENKRRRDEFVRELDVDASWKSIERRISSKRGLRRFIWVISSSAAAILIVLITLIHSFYQEPERQISSTEIQAGTAKAVLITPGGKQFNLAHQDSAHMLNLGEGLLAITEGRAIKYIGKTDSLRPSEKFNRIRIPRGGEYELILPDGSHVWLNSDSELSFPVRFDDNKREVVLSGEAYFSIAKNENSPFVVKTKDISIRVLGTQFNVQAYPDADVVETTLCRGAVNVSDGELDITLEPFQQAVYRKANKELTKRKVDIRLYTAWKEGFFVFENKPLEEIMKVLARWYDIRVFYADPVLKTYHFTGDLERYNDFQKTLSMIEKATTIKFVVKDKDVIVKKH